MCRCKDKASYTPSAMGVKRSFPSPDETGTIMLQSKPDCIDPYVGPFRKMTILVVGFGTDSERLFKRGDRTAALQHARQHKVSLDPVNAGELCSAAVEELLGA